jgi:hypothetical protein
MNASSLRKIARLVMPVLLLLSVVPLLFVQNVMSQQFRTLTSYTTTTGTSSSLEYYSEATVSTKTIGFTWTFSVTGRLGRSPGCLAGYAAFPFTITTSQTVHVDYTSSSPTDFALYDSQAFGAWQLGLVDPCNLFIAFKELGVTSGSFDIPMSPSGNPYWFIFIHRGSGTYPQIRMAVNGVLLPQAAFVTLTSTHMLTRTETIASYETQQVPFLEANGEWLLPLGIVVIVAAVLIVTWLTLGRKGTRRRKKRRTTR